MRHRAVLPAALLVTVVAFVLEAGVGRCQSLPAPPPPRPTPTATTNPEQTPSGGAATATPTPAPTGSPAGQGYRPTLVPCRQAARAGDGALDATRRDLYDTLCEASLWLDGLFGRHGSLEAAERINGRAELAVLRSSVAGTKVNTGLDVNFKLPHLEKRLNVFIGRSDPQDYVRDRQEGFGLRSQFVGLESREKWLAGLGYSLPGAVGDRVSLRAGVAGGVHAIVFGQAVYQQNIAVGERNLWYLREVAYWKRLEGFGFTSSADYDHVLTKTLLLRWGTVGTVSEGSHGLDWRTALVLYQNLHRTRAMAYEAFLRGVSGTLGLTEYGARAIYRQSVFRSWFFVDPLLGYSWLRLNPGERHRGSTIFGLGGELWFGPEAH
ncbi:MAG: hypothetical protein LAO05_04135 [Acidobacteriia bacterium]|nr:hypothetical protein [Terriglobia bacterium]